ncbi:MAG: lytic transglycosylase domain-containing protein [bacterium]
MFVSFLIELLKKTTYISLMALLFFSLMSFSHSAKKLEEQDQEIRELSRNIKNYESAMKIDSVRAQAIEKVLGIINRYNRALSDSLKYEIANEIFSMSVKYSNLDINLICATITHESARTWRPDIVSPAGANGLMQIMPHTGRFLSRHEGIPWTSTQEILHNPIYNIRMGCRYLSMLIELYNVDGGLAAYNGGERRAARWLASGRDNEVLYEETRSYVPAVLELYDHYKK